MCGIIGVVGSSDTLSTLLEGLQRLEYRGYDSAGVALVRPGQTWRARAADGTQSVAALRLECEHAPSGFSSGIGHTRWATHGAPEAVTAQETLPLFTTALLKTTQNFKNNSNHADTYLHLLLTQKYLHTSLKKSVQRA